MSIDWVTVLAQLGNFLVLAWLLKRFLYRPILEGVDAREAEIARRLAAADEARAQAQAAEQRFVRQHEDSLQRRDEVVAQALQDTEVQREQLMADARAQIDQQRRVWQDHMEHERSDFLRRLQRAGALTLAELARKALHDLADEALEAAVVRRAGRHLAAMGDELRAAAGASRQAQVSTRAALAEAPRQALQAALAALLPGVAVQFSADPEQSPGLVLQVGGARVDWTIDSYMDEFDDALMQDQVAGLPVPSHGHES